MTGREGSYYKPGVPQNPPPLASSALLKEVNVSNPPPGKPLKHPLPTVVEEEAIVMVVAHLQQVAGDLGVSV